MRALQDGRLLCACTNRGVFESIYAPNQFMNPGPAPRPPTDRPRLNLTPSTANLPGNMSQMSLQSPSTIRNTATFQPGSNVSLPIQRSQSGPATQGGFTVLKNGWAKVKDDSIGSFFWNKKWLILREYT